MKVKWRDLFPEPIRTILGRMPPALLEQVEEIRIREGRPLEINAGNNYHFLTPEGVPTGKPEEAYVPLKEITHRLLDLISNHSLYTLEEELRKGFITIPGGHRIGLAGRTVLSGGRVEYLRDINGFNVRVAREVQGVADPVLPYLLDMKNGQVLHTLILSPPQQGKTTLLRDLARQISNGTKLTAGGELRQGIRPRLKVGIVDERSEIAGSYKGVPSFDVGPRTDVMDGCPKAEGMMMMLRSMSPDVLIVDEIGRPEDAEAVMEALHAGVSVIATAHARDLSELAARPALKTLIAEQMFQRYVQLKRTGRGMSFQLSDGKMRGMQQTGAGGEAFA
ncbi:stage III sporulation protein AA [Paenibacillus polysaccharolyticus]|uniref:stage III sporulation protein AA n=1 Tax=Paenibacillus polysaccharolyticus TaxID=582692 RepID=UPI0020420336|nr:stage III sporulation protein AA [Paenibacillus polysaccharolyticus]MCM3136062.1 stage III sporulation protein AA [Paenibacillus polysaccharolyticus]